MAELGTDGARPPDALTRRGFLALAASAAGASYARVALGAPEEGKLRMPFGRPPSQVVRVQSPHAVAGSAVHQTVLREMLDAALTALTGATRPSDAWQALLKPDDVVGLKFNRSGQTRLGTTAATAGALVESILAAGFSSSQLVCIEAPAEVESKYGTRPARLGYATTPTDFGSGQDQLALVLDQVTALIDIPFLKTHRLATLTSALKNLSHGLIKHPARYHRNGCSPYIADIVATEDIQSKLRLCLVDALRIEYGGGPQGSKAATNPAGILLATSDPVAADTVGLEILADLRRNDGLSPLARSASDIPYLAASHRRGLGIALLHGIDLLRVEP